MTEETSDIELGQLQRRARRAGYYVNRHMSWDAARGNGDLYLSKAKRVRTDPTEPWIMKFATAAQIEARLAKIEEANAWAARKATTSGP